MLPHSTCVNAWLERAGGELPSEKLVAVFEDGFAVLWRRAHQTLGDVTLMAIADRVFYTAAEKHGFLSALKIEPTGLDCGGLRKKARSLSKYELQEGIRTVMVEFLTVIGKLTAEVISSALQAELENHAPQSSEIGAGQKSKHRPRKSRTKGRKDQD